MDYSLCPHKNILGTPNEGIHQYRILNIAIADVIGTIVVSYLLAKQLKQDFKLMLIVIFLLGIILHRLFCVETTIDKFLFTKNT
jgi:hypothetical protein